ncbi:Cmrf35-Like Molecule 1 [Manis pentadactyla]|nr:Cmrf35-Like Molecule 1 [Manis pentadactyla]
MAVMSNLDKTAERNSEKSTFRVWSLICHQGSRSEHKVRMNHVSIGDDQMNRVFTVTLEELRWSDADTYWCGIERIGHDLGVQVKVAADPAFKKNNFAFLSRYLGILQYDNLAHTTV